MKKKNTKQPKDHPDAKYRMMAEIGLTSTWIKGLWTTFLAPYGVSTQQFNILRILRAENDWMMMQDVKARMFEPAPNTTRLADKLVANKLIDRERSSDDRRVVFVKVTGKGISLLKKIDAEKRGPQYDFLENVTVEEAKNVAATLRKLRN